MAPSLSASAPEPQNLKFLTVEQAIADFGEVMLSIRREWKAPIETAVVTFGGSYGANLAMWMRLKQPNLVAGAIASSVSVQKSVLRETNDFYMIVTEAYGNVSTACPRLVRQGWDDLRSKAQSEAGRREIVDAMGLCGPPPTSPDFVDGLIGWIEGALETMAQYGYPYPTSFYNPVPGYPFRVACHRMVDANTGLGALRAAADIYYNYTGQAGACFSNEAAMSAGHRHRRARLGLSIITTTESGWGYQTCTEVYQPMPTNGLYPTKGGDMFLPSTPNDTANFQSCKQQFGVVPRPDWEEHRFWGPNLQAGSNIFLSSGQVDPWRAAGVGHLKGGPASIEFHLNLMGAHHLDIRATNPLDPPSVVECRGKQREAISRWVREWKANPPVPTSYKAPGTGFKQPNDR